MEFDVASWQEMLTTVVIPLGLRVLGGIVVLIIGWIVAAWVGRVVRKRLEKSPKADQTLAKFFASTTKIVILLFAVVAMLNQFGIQTASIIAVLGAAGLAVGLALQGTLSHLASGVMLLIFRPFSVGEAVNAGGHLGVVEEIGLFAIQLRGFDGVPQTVPNGSIWGSEVSNYSRAITRRVDMTFGIGYGDDIGAALDVVRSVVTGDERVLDDPEPVLEVNELGDSSVNLLARFWVAPADYFQIQWDFNRRVKERFDADGISIPFPQRDVHLFQA